MIFRLVSMRHGNPFSIREMVIGDTLAARASSALLIKSASLALLKAFSFIGPNSFNVWVAVDRRSLILPVVRRMVPMIALFEP